MTEDITKPSENTKEAERSIVDERPIIKEENIYHSRGCSCKPGMEDSTRPLQMCQCAKLATFDWSKDMALNDGNDTHRLIEVRFKNSRKDFYKLDTLKDALEVGDMVVLEAASGYDVGLVTLKGPLAYLQYKKRENGA